jgi:hypothetical protein
MLFSKLKLYQLPKWKLFYRDYGLWIPLFFVWKGDFYLQHVDQFQNNSSRKYSMISYLNSDWQPADGGELMIHQDRNQNYAHARKDCFF